MQHAVAAAWSDFETVWQRAVAHVVKVEQHGEYRDVISALALMGSLWEKRTRALGMVSAPSVHVDASQRTANVTQLILERRSVRHHDRTARAIVSPVSRLPLCDNSRHHRMTCIPSDLECRAALWALDPAAFARACGFEPDPWQLEALRSAHRQLAFNCSRQSGKTTTTAVLAAREAVLHPESLTLVYARAQRQAVELLRKVKGALAALGDAAPPLIRDNEQDVELETRARVLALPSTEHTTRGFSAPRLVVFDEAARVSDDLYYAVRPMLAVSQGRLVLLSSSWNASGFFYG